MKKIYQAVPLIGLIYILYIGWRNEYYGLYSEYGSIRFGERVIGFQLICLTIAIAIPLIL